MDNRTIINTMKPRAEMASGEKKRVTCAMCEDVFMQLFENHCCGFDVSALMNVRADEEEGELRQIRLLSIIEAVCMRLDKAIFVSEAAFRELEHISERWDDHIGRAARRALDLLNRLRKERLLEVYSCTADGENWIPGKCELLRTVMMVRGCSEKPVLVFTRDQELAAELLKLNQSLMSTGPRVSVYRTDMAGMPVRFILPKS